MSIVNISAYRFVALPSAAAWRAPLKERCDALGLKGTILLSPEGINLFLAGTRKGIDAILDTLRHDALFAGCFAGLEAKESLSDDQPFSRMLVKLKREIITMRRPTIRPEAGRAPAVNAPTLKRWLDQGHDDAGRPVVLLDTRNDFEVGLGTFTGALDLRLAHFGDFPQAVDALAPGLADKCVVTFCTGGIRCEKAALYMAPAIPGVLQLEGGILKYFEEVGGAHWQGECFVFDRRVALTPDLNPTGTRQCFACRAVVTPAAQSDPRYVPDKSCPACAANVMRSDARSAASAACPSPAVPA